ncbi:WXG100-like domain-containing protein, partial [Nocardia higoensis]|uniref:WXG100-like domain-containing protein n=1 Tax=Nocardia higoensis TaxID=228599 RepID=UPI000594860D
MAELPGYLRWLEWVAGSDWPAGEPEGMWGIADDWRTAAEGLRAILDDIDAAKAASIAAYPQGEGIEKMTEVFDDLRSGDQSLEALAKYFDGMAESADAVGTEMEYAQLMMISSLALLAIEIAAAWAFPPTAPAVQATAIGLTRVGIRILAQRLMNRIIQQVAKLVGQKVATFVVRHLALDTMIGTFQEAGVQGY